MGLPSECARVAEKLAQRVASCANVLPATRISTMGAAGCAVVETMSVRGVPQRRTRPQVIVQIAEATGVAMQDMRRTPQTARFRTTMPTTSCGKKASPLQAFPLLKIVAEPLVEPIYFVDQSSFLGSSLCVCVCVWTRLLVVAVGFWWWQGSGRLRPSCRHGLEGSCGLEGCKHVLSLDVREGG